MAFFDSLLQRLGIVLPRNHLLAVAGLLGLLLILSALPDEADDNRLDLADESTDALSPAEGLPTDPHPTPSDASPASSSMITEPVLAHGADDASKGPLLAESPASSAELLTPAPPPESIAASDTEPTSPAEEKPEPRYTTEVRPGDNLSLIFSRAGLTARDVYEITSSSDEATVLSRLYPGYTLAFDIDDEQELRELEVVKSALESIVFTRLEDGGYRMEQIRHEPEVRHSFKSSTIDSSLFLSAQRDGIPIQMAMEMAGIFGGVIDFILDTRRGDSFDILYEERYLDDEFVGHGNILAARFTNRGRTYTALRYEDAEGDVDYYNPQGESMRKAFLRNPVDFTRISSGFNLRRKHPILNTIRAHKGTDYAAPNGTPVVATSDGRVTWAGRKGSFGKLVVLQHGQQYETKYAHLSGYAKGIKNGARVKQGQVIGYVGATGGATGPHLHYEFLIDGVHRNSRTIHDKLPKAESLAEEEMQHFREQTQILLTRLDTYTDNPRLAQRDDEDTDKDQD